MRRRELFLLLSAATALGAAVWFGGAGPADVELLGPGGFRLSIAPSVRGAALEPLEDYGTPVVVLRGAYDKGAGGPVRDMEVIASSVRKLEWDSPPFLNESRPAAIVRRVLQGHRDWELSIDVRRSKPGSAPRRFSARVHGQLLRRRDAIVQAALRALLQGAE